MLYSMDKACNQESEVLHKCMLTNDKASKCSIDAGSNKKGQPRMANPLNLFGAEGETRTRTDIYPLDPEPSASTSSATSAHRKAEKSLISY